MFNTVWPEFKMDYNKKKGFTKKLFW
jgi:hypothetical protein